MQVCFSSGASVKGPRFSVARYSLILSRQACRQFSTKKTFSAEEEELEAFVEEELDVFAEEELTAFADDDAADDFGAFSEEELAGFFAEEELETFVEEELDVFTEEELTVFADDELPDFFDDELALLFVLDEDFNTSEGEGISSASWVSYFTTET